MEQFARQPLMVRDLSLHLTEVFFVIFTNPESLKGQEPDWLVIQTVLQSVNVFRDFLGLSGGSGGHSDLPVTRHCLPIALLQQSVHKLWTWHYLVEDELYPRWLITFSNITRRRLSTYAALWSDELRASYSRETTPSTTVCPLAPTASVAVAINERNNEESKHVL